MLLSACISVLVTLLPANLCQKADSLYEKDRYQETVLYINGYLPAVREAEEQDILANLLSTLAASYSRLGAYDLALDVQQECLNLDIAAGDDSAISSSLNNLAAICLSLEDYDQAEKLIRDAIEYEKPLGNTQALAVRYGIASDILAKQGKADEALKFAQEAYSLDEAAGRSNKAAIRLSQLAERHIEAGQLDDAWDCLQKAVPVLEAGNHLHSLAICRQQQGVVASRKGRDDMAVNYFREALRLSRETGDLLIQKNTLYGLIEALQGTKPSAALVYAKEYIYAKDSLFRKETAQQISRLHLQYDLASKEQALQIQNARVRSYRTQAILLLIIIILLLVVIIAVISGLRKKHKHEVSLLRASLLKEKLLATNPSEQAAALINRVSKELTENQPVVQLSAREKEVAKYCCEGLLAKEIAYKMGISTRTVETHKNNIFHKLGINSTAELIQWMRGGGKSL